MNAGLNYFIGSHIRFMNTSLCSEKRLLARDGAGMSVFVLGKWALGRQQRSKCGNQGETDGAERAWRVGRGVEEETRRSSGGAEGRASQVSTFLSIFHQVG